MMLFWHYNVRHWLDISTTVAELVPRRCDVPRHMVPLECRDRIFRILSEGQRVFAVKQAARRIQKHIDSEQVKYLETPSMQLALAMLTGHSEWTKQDQERAQLLARTPTLCSSFIILAIVLKREGLWIRSLKQTWLCEDGFWLNMSQVRTIDGWPLPWFKPSGCWDVEKHCNFWRRPKCPQKVRRDWDADRIGKCRMNMTADSLFFFEFYMSHEWRCFKIALRKFLGRCSLRLFMGDPQPALQTFLQPLLHTLVESQARVDQVCQGSDSKATATAVNTLISSDVFRATYWCCFSGRSPWLSLNFSLCWPSYWCNVMTMRQIYQI